MMTTTINVKFTAPGFHRWKDAPEHRAYLAQPHRHLFHVDVTLEVWHGDREVEFHDLLDEVKEVSAFSNPNVQSPDPSINEFINFSCEHHAERIMDYLKQKYSHRSIMVRVSEDDECSASLTYMKP